MNVIDNRVPESLVGDTEFILQHSRNSVNDEDKTVLRLDASAGNFAFHLDAYTRENDNVEVPGFAVDEVSVERLEELVAEHIAHDEDHDDEEGHEEEEFENTNGFIGNSDSKADAATLGFSYVGDNGFLGFSASRLENEYGLPPGAHSHGHGEEEHHDEPDAPVIRLVQSILMGAVHAGASDIHLEPHHPQMRIRYRVDGQMQQVMKAQQHKL